jgi:hypothetical protein
MLEMMVNVHLPVFRIRHSGLDPESSIVDFHNAEKNWIPAGACPSRIKAGAGMTLLFYNVFRP